MNKAASLSTTLFTSPPNSHGISSPSRYEHIYDTLKQAIQSEQLELGTVILESPIAKLFGTSREPVRKALGMLHQENLISTFEGRGYLVGNRQTIPPSIQPKRTDLSTVLLQNSQGQTSPEFLSHSERVVDTLEDIISLSIIFGHFSISEQEAAQTFGVSRGSIREALNRLRERGLIEKSTYSNWRCGPLTTEAVLHDYELRILLEPVALAQSAQHIPASWLNKAIHQVQCALNKVDQCTPSLIYQIEKMLHIDLLQYAPNKKILDVIHKSHTPLIVNHIFFQAFQIEPDTESLEEHLKVLNLIAIQDYDEAANELATHVKQCKQRVLPRLKALSVLPEPELPNYMQRIA